MCALYHLSIKSIVTLCFGAVAGLTTWPLVFLGGALRASLHGMARSFSARRRPIQARFEEDIASEISFYDP